MSLLLLFNQGAVTYFPSKYVAVWRYDMIQARKQSTTTYPIPFFMVDSTDHITAKTGLTPAVTISKNGGAFGAASGAVSEISDGWYALAGNATDRDTLGTLAIHATSAGADAVDISLLIVSYDPFADIASILADTGTDGVVLANDAITAAKIAADAIGADEIAAGAVTKIQTGLATPTNITAGTIATVTNLTNLPSIPNDWITAAGIKSDAVEEIADGVWDEALSGHTTTGSAGKALSTAESGSVGAGAGATTKVYTVTDGSNPIADVDVWVTTDILGANVVASGKSNSSGKVIFYLDSGTTYYIWKQKDGYDFTNPDTEVA